MEVDNQPNIWVCSQRADHRELIIKHLILHYNDTQEKNDYQNEMKIRKKYCI